MCFLLLFRAVVLQFVVI